MLRGPGPLRNLSTLTLINTTGNGLWLTVNALYLTRVGGLSAGQVGLGLTVAGAVCMVASAPMGYLADRRGPRGTQAVFLAALAVLALGMLVVRSFAALVVRLADRRRRSRAAELRPDYPVRTERLLLRPLTVRDVDMLLAYRSRPEVCRYVPFEPMDRRLIEERLAGQWACTALTDEGQGLTLGAELAQTGELIGDVILFWHSREHRGGEIGYVLNPDFSGRGYATEAARAMLGLGFDGLGLHRIIARVDERNEASARVARRLGMRQEARLVQNELFKGEWSTELDFAMLADEWPAHRG